MTSPRPLVVNGPVSTFLLERYLPPVAADWLAASVARVARLCTDSRRFGIEGEYRYSAYLPADDTCFCVFRAHSSNDVREVNAKAVFAFDRITSAVPLLPGDFSACEANDSSAGSRATFLPERDDHDRRTEDRTLPDCGGCHHLGGGRLPRGYASVRRCRRQSTTRADR